MRSSRRVSCSQKRDPPPVNLWPALSLPATKNGVTFTQSPTGGVHATGESTGWATVRETISLERGEYTLDGTVSTHKDLFCEVKPVDTTQESLYSTSRLSGTLEGQVQCIVSVAPGKTVDGDITPVLTRIG